MNDMPQTPSVYLGLFADDTYKYVTDCKKGYVFRKLQRGLNAIETWCERWNTKINNNIQESTFLIDLGPLRLILHLIDGISPLSIT
jgi:hypothetical protein